MNQKMILNVAIGTVVALVAWEMFLKDVVNKQGSDMRFIASGNMLTQRHTVDLPVAQYEALYLYMSGTNNSSQTVALSDMNNIRVNRSGQDLVNVDFDRLESIVDLKHGLTVNSSSSGSSFEFAFLIPFYVGQKGEFPNALDVQQSDLAKVTFLFPGVTLALLIMSAALPCR